MAIELLAIYPKHETRIRLVFTNTLAAGAFGVSPTFFTITSQDAFGVSPSVKASIVVPGAATNLELALSSPLAPGGKYLLAAVGVPATDTTTSTTASQQIFAFGESKSIPNVELAVSDADVDLYGRDIVWTGEDFLETTDGDLERVSGVENAQQAVLRRLVGHPLNWDQTYSPNARNFVDGPAPGIITLKGSILDQCMKDDRVRTASVTFSQDSALPDEAFFLVDVTLIGGQTPEPIPVAIPVG